MQEANKSPYKVKIDFKTDVLLSYIGRINVQLIEDINRSIDLGFPKYLKEHPDFKETFNEVIELLEERGVMIKIEGTDKYYYPASLTQKYSIQEFFDMIPKIKEENQ